MAMPAPSRHRSSTLRRTRSSRQARSVKLSNGQVELAQRTEALHDGQVEVQAKINTPMSKMEKLRHRRSSWQPSSRRSSCMSRAAARTRTSPWVASQSEHIRGTMAPLHRCLRFVASHLAVVRFHIEAAAPSAEWGWILVVLAEMREMAIRALKTL